MNKSGERLKLERERLGISAAKLAEIGGVGRTVQYNYEKNISNPDTDYLARVASVGIDILYIVTGKRTPVQMSSLSIEETSLVDYYRHAAAEGRKALEATGAAVAKQKKPGKIA